MSRTTHSAQERANLLVTVCPTLIFMSFYGTKLKVFEQITKGCEKNVVEQTILGAIAETSYKNLTDLPPKSGMRNP